MAEYTQETGAELFAVAFAAGLPLPAALDSHLEEALRHVLGHRGSLVRPLMVYRVARAFDLGGDRARDQAVAVEYFPTASLFFDDLPCMDNATERRGAPCAHLAYGEAGAILTALALINRAYALVWKSAAGSPPGSQASALAYVEQRLGVEGLLNGQSLDLHYSALPHNRETTERIAIGKTVSLIRLTLVLPAILGDAPAREVQLLERISMYWGLSYQMVDDLKDVLDSPAAAGKTVARDALLDHPNIAAVAGIPAAVERLMRCIRLGDRALALLVRAKPTMSFLEGLRESLESELIRVTGRCCELSIGERA